MNPVKPRAGGGGHCYHKLRWFYGNADKNGNDRVAVKVSPPISL